MMSIAMLAITLKLTTGSIAPWDAGWDAWKWLVLSGFVGYVFGDFCLFNSYLLIGSRFGQLFMTLAPPTAAIAGYLFLGEKMGIYAIAGMSVCIIGIGFSIVGKSSGGGKRLCIQLPLKGVLYGIGAGVGQGLGLVLSKIGMNCYLDFNPPVTALEKFMLPFEATQIRAFAGGDWLFSHFIIARRNKETCRFILRPPCNDGFNSGYFLRTVCRCLVIVNGRAIYSCRSGLYINGSHANYHFIAVESSFPGENNISPSSWSCHQRVGCRFVLCISFIAIIRILQS